MKDASQVSAGAIKPSLPPSPKTMQWRVCLQSLLIPVVVLVFFIAAPHWLNIRVRSSILESFQKRFSADSMEFQQQRQHFEAIDLQEISQDNDPQNENLRLALQKAGVTANFQRLHWGLMACCLLVALLVASLVAVVLLNRRAGRSAPALVSAYRLGWRISMAATLIKVLLLIPLLTYGIFEFSVLLTDHYLPKLLFFIVLGGLFALWQSGRVLLKHVPLEFQQPLSREVTPQDAPELWEAVRSATTRLNTTPPDHIIVGMELNCFVTELAVIHNGGRTSGKTLFLSYPMLQHLSDQEVLAIIGHELGHFIGGDTQMSREFYPLKLKAHATLMALGRSGWAARTSFYFLSFFFWCFEETQQTASRTRELLADQKGAILTSAHTTAQALVKFQVLTEAFQRGLKEAVERQASNPLNLPLRAIIREQLFPETDFWSGLFEKKLIHPLDSHPPLGVRLEALGQKIGVEEARIWVQEENETAFSRWLAGREALFSGIVGESEKIIGKMQEQTKVSQADYQTAAGRELLDRCFPRQSWKGRAGHFWFMQGLLWLLMAGCVALALAVNQMAASLILSAITLALGLCAVGVWIRHHQAQFSVDGEGVHHTGWLAPVRFQEIHNITARMVYGSVTLTFHLKARRPAPWKFNLVRFPRKNIVISLSSLRGKQVEIAKTVFRYFTRQMEQQ